jgi:hypothetical protein
VQVPQDGFVERGIGVQGERVADVSAAQQISGAEGFDGHPPDPV